MRIPITSYKYTAAREVVRGGCGAIAGHRGDRAMDILNERRRGRDFRYKRRRRAEARPTHESPLCRL